LELLKTNGAEWERLEKEMMELSENSPWSQ
jgi:hypothetical protein